MSVFATVATWKLKIKVTAIQKLILLALANRAGENGECWPSIRRMMEDTSLNRKTLIDNRHILIDLGLIEYTGQFQGRSRQIPVMRLTYVESNHDDSEQYFTGTENGSGKLSTSPKNGTGDQSQKRDTESKRLESKKIRNKTYYLDKRSARKKTRAVASAPQSLVCSPKSDYNAQPLSTDTDMKKNEYKETYYSITGETQKVPEPKQKRQVKSTNILGLEELLQNNKFNLPEDVLRDWIAVRKTKRAAITMTAWNMLQSELQKFHEAGLSPVDVFRDAVAQGWSTVKFSWHEERERKSKSMLVTTGQARETGFFDYHDTSWGKDINRRMGEQSSGVLKIGEIV